MISRSPMWMLLATCAFLSAGFSEVAKAAPEQGDGAVNRISVAQASLLISQAAESTPSEAEGEKAPATAIERPTLSLGSSGPLVIQVQVLLEDQGFYEGSIDGEFSEATAEAVKAFQLDQKLEPTGAVDKATWGPLTGESAAPKTADESEKTADSAESAGSAGANDSAAIAETSAGEAADAKQRLLMGVVALLGLGAGGFGLWKILSVPVPRPLAYPNGSDDDDDFMDAPGPGLGHHPGSDIVAQGGAAGYAPTAITVPATVAAQPPSALTLGPPPWKMFGRRRLNSLLMELGRSPIEPR